MSDEDNLLDRAAQREIAIFRAKFTAVTGVFTAWVFLMIVIFLIALLIISFL